MIITITGKPCSGKGTLSNAFAKKYGFSIFKAGDLFKAEAARRGMSAAEFSVYRVNDPSFDYEIDKQFGPMGIEKANENIIIESRVAWHFIPHSFKVFLDIDDEVMIERLLNSDRTGKEKYETKETAKQALEERENYDRFRYKKIYNIDIMDKSNFDCVLDSSHNTPEELADMLFAEYQKFCERKKKIILIHGMSCPMNECFGLKVKERLEKHNFEIIEPIFPVNEEITYEKWNKVIDKLVDKVDENTSFLCHSLGCHFVIKYLFRKKAKCNAVIAVAGAVPSLSHPVFQKVEAMEKFIPNQEEFDYFKRNTKVVYDIHSDNDHLFTQENFDLYIKKTGAQGILIKNQGHFGRSSGVKDIPEIEDILNLLDKIS